MPFKSQKQRALFHAAKNSPKVRMAHGMKMATVDEMIGHDAGGKLPKRAKKRKAKSARY